MVPHYKHPVHLQSKKYGDHSHIMKRTNDDTKVCRKEILSFRQPHPLKLHCVLLNSNLLSRPSIFFFYPSLSALSSLPAQVPSNPRHFLDILAQIIVNGLSTMK